jgi:transposase
MWMIDVEESLKLRDLFNKDLSISEIARQTGHSRVTVRKYLNSQVPPLNPEAIPKAEQTGEKGNSTVPRWFRLFAK